MKAPRRERVVAYFCRVRFMMSLVQVTRPPPGEPTEDLCLMMMCQRDNNNMWRVSSWLFEIHLHGGNRLASDQSREGERAKPIVDRCCGEGESRQLSMMLVRGWRDQISVYLFALMMVVCLRELWYILRLMIMRGLWWLDAFVRRLTITIMGSKAAGGKAKKYQKYVTFRALPYQLIIRALPVEDDRPPWETQVRGRCDSQWTKLIFYGVCILITLRDELVYEFENMGCIILRLEILLHIEAVSVYWLMTMYCFPVHVFIPYCSHVSQNNL